MRELVEQELKKVSQELGLGAPTALGEAFNLHYRAGKVFVKVTRKGTPPTRLKNELLISSALSAAGHLVPQPLVEELVPLPESGRWCSFWENLEPLERLSESEGSWESYQAIRTVSQWAAPLAASPFHLEDFVTALHERLADSTTPLAELILETVEHMELPPPGFGTQVFLHGDLHHHNLVRSSGELVIVDWESSCVGPIEWDVAQQLRYAPRAEVPLYEELWLKEELDWDMVRACRRIRTLSSLSHFVSHKTYPPLFYRGVEELGWSHLLKGRLP